MRVIGRLMRDSSRGGSAVHGAKFIPDHLKRKGLAEHPKMEQYLKSHDGVPPNAPCGIIAFLMGYDKERYIKNFEKLIEDAAMYGNIIGLESRFMTNGDFDKLLSLDGFTDYRVIVFRFDSQAEYFAQGDDWEWGNGDKEQLRTIPDPKSIYVLRDDLDQQNKHYWWVEAIASCAFTRGLNKHCYFCFRQAVGQTFDDHNCSGVLNYQCKICKFYFTSADSFNDHRSRSTEEYKCDCCERTKFNGIDCFERHERNNCNPPPGFKKGTCEDCDRKYMIGSVHECSNFGICWNCDHKYIDKTDYKEHRCYMQETEAFWEPVTEKNLFTCHFAYDYETCREIIPEDTEEEVKEFKHEVMAWCVQLMLPCTETIQYVIQSEFREKIIDKIEKSPNDVFNDIQFEMLQTGSIRIQGNFFYFLLKNY